MWVARSGNRRRRPPAGQGRLIEIVSFHTACKSDRLNSGVAIGQFQRVDEDAILGPIDLAAGSEQSLHTAERIIVVRHARRDCRRQPMDLQLEAGLGSQAGLRMDGPPNCRQGANRKRQHDRRRKPRPPDLRTPAIRSPAPEALGSATVIKARSW